ncbi:hypothetical protein GOP47_0007517 [Adiantum capillus-veneris]|uniref:Thioredoxin domain-containing protein n=1 Tax=Adiantum capillus-veneris TaxID=13818 RepID=A0A9D4ZJA6_ADICA|nr:hypothetical protein GOP47_0007517 [Adiantum capillus-veneris]
MLRARASWRGLRFLGGLPAHPSSSPCPSRLLRIQAVVFSPSYSPSRPLPVIRHFTSTPGGSSSSVIAVKNDAEYVSAINLAQENNGLAVVYFTAKWCGPCRMISPIVDELSTKYDKATFLKVDIDEEKLREVVSEEKITSVPTFRYFRGGKSVGELIGADARLLKDKVAALCFWTV